MGNPPVSRRAFLRGSAGLTILAAGGSASGFQANQKLNIAQVGVSGRGSWFIQCIPRMGENFAALCDVNDQKSAEAYSKFPDAKKYHDFRKMLDQMDKGIDAVIAAVPDHAHAIVSVTAMKHGKHIYCEKPLTRTVREARIVRETARKAKVATQMGNQGTSTEAFRRAVDWLRAGVIGEVREFHVWNGGGPGRTAPPSGSQPVPDYLQWDLWLGPAADRPFHREWFQWHVWRDFATGNLGNWGPHTTNIPFMGLNIHTLWHAAPAGPAPLVRVTAKVPAINTVSFPQWEMIRFEVPARGGMPPVTFFWHNGTPQPDGREHTEAFVKAGLLKWEANGQRKYGNWAGLLLVGSKGMIFATEHNGKITLLPEEQFKDFQGPPPVLPRSPGHEQEWLRACKGGAPAMSSFDYAGPFVEFLMLGNVASQVEGPIEYDPLAGKIVNNPGADRLLGSECRKGWSL
jgi:predicted dehydrogenase